MKNKTSFCFLLCRYFSTLIQSLQLTLRNPAYSLSILNSSGKALISNQYRFQSLCPILSSLSILILLSVSNYAQSYSIPATPINSEPTDANGIQAAHSIAINGLPDLVTCSSTSGSVLCDVIDQFDYNPTLPCGDLNQFLLDTPFSNYHTVNYDEPINMSVTLLELQDDRELFISAQIIYNPGLSNEEIISGGEYITENSAESMHVFSLSVTPTLGAERALLAIRITDVVFPGGDLLQFYYFPLIITGPVDRSVEVLSTAVEPSSPFLVLHDPPGDGSSSSSVASQTVCQEISNNYTESFGNSSQIGVKLGVKGELGIILTTEFEFSVQLNAGVSVEETQTSDSSYERCMTMTQEFSTSDLDNSPGNGSDLFIGFGRRLLLGAYDNVEINASCQAENNKRLVWAPDPGTETTFIWTKDQIESDISALSTTFNNTSLPDELRNNARNQIDVWQEVLQRNDLNIALATTGTQLNDYSLVGGGSTVTIEEEISITEATSLSTELAVGTTAGLEFVVEVAGSGVNGSTEFSYNSTKGMSTTDMNSNTKLFSYTLIDDDNGDVIAVKTYRDPEYGTPIFINQAGMITSCPYEGGTRRDRPAMSVNTGQDLCANLLGQVYADFVDDAFIATLNLCNNNPTESRSYSLKLNNNLNGAIVSVGATVLNSANNFIQFSVSAGDCVNPVLTIEQNPVTMETVYDNLELRF